MNIDLDTGWYHLDEVDDFWEMLLYFDKTKDKVFVFKITIRKIQIKYENLKFMSNVMEYQNFRQAEYKDFRRFIVKNFVMSNGL